MIGGLSLGSLFFASPWVLVALIALPALYWILRVVPPAPKRLRFPALRLLLGLQSKEETSATTPWWLLLMRLAMAALVILALSGPSLNPPPPVPGQGPVVLVVETGWGAARNWPAIRERGEEVLRHAQQEGRSVLLVTTTGQVEETPGTASAVEARRRFAALTPHAYEDTPSVVPAVIRAVLGDREAGIVWLSDGLADDERHTALESLRDRGSVILHAPDPSALPIVLRPGESTPAGLTATLAKADDLPRTVTVTARAADGRELGRAEAAFDAGDRTAETMIRLPRELANTVSRLDIAESRSAGSVALLDDRWRRRAVGLVTGAGYDASQPLLDERHYLTQALLPFADVTVGTLDRLAQTPLSMIVLPDTGLLPEADRARALTFIEQGGILMRFAGPALAADATDAELVPVELRSGGRLIGGALSWDDPARLAPFPESGPFASLTVQEDVVVRRQVLAEPSLTLVDKTWAALEDGTPLVTATKEGEGWLVLVHTTAIPEWTDLPISGMFVEMLSRIVDLGRGVDPVEAETLLPPLDLMDGFGQLGAPRIAATALQGGEDDPVASRETPPGWYGTQAQRRAVNLGTGLPDPVAMDRAPTGVIQEGYVTRATLQFAGPLLTMALVLFLLDFVASLGLRGLLTLRSTAAGLIALGLFSALPSGANAQQQDDTFAIQATENFRLAYIRTGLDAIDNKSRAGLVGLTRQLYRRTAVEPEDPLGVTPGVDEMAFFPLLYWPIPPEHPDLDPAAVDALNQYLTNGGTIVFDTADEAFGDRGGSRRLQELAEQLDIPTLQPTDPEHVLTKTFYLMQEFPGRYTGGVLWVEASAGDGDEVSSVIAGSHDWAAAWATDENGRAIYPMPGSGLRQREWSYRFGINLVMYALTGNYKADQVHLPAILERLGQ
ncbi:MAG: DUF4159 domain-containing protein [Alphaproteobacteria bacterium]|nr:DUF4159 domain-containing protein [Alphaproteobacteria bacterium]